MSNTIVITTLDSVTVNGKPVGSITNALGNGNATAQEIHDALTAYVAPLLSAQFDKTTLQSNIDRLVAAGIQARGNLPAMEAVLDQAVPFSSAGIAKAATDAIAAANATIAAHQAILAAVAPQPTPMPTPTPSA